MNYDYFGLGDRREREPEVWEDERTGLLCRISNLYGGVGVSSDHPWFNRQDCPIEGTISYGVAHYPEECEGKWWFYFSIDKEDYDHIKKRCMILAALLEVEGTELAQEITSLPPSSPVKPPEGDPIKCTKQGVKREGEEDDGEDNYDYELFKKVFSTLEDYDKQSIDLRLAKEYLAVCADEH